MSDSPGAMWYVRVDEEGKTYLFSVTFRFTWNQIINMDGFTRIPVMVFESDLITYRVRILRRLEKSRNVLEELT